MYQDQRVESRGLVPLHQLARGGLTGYNILARIALLRMKMNNIFKLTIRSILNKEGLIENYNQST
jgi:hypothetical protein